MALAIKVIYTAVDDKGQTATTEIKVPTGFTIAQYVEFAQAMAAIIDDIIAGRLTSANFCVGVDLSGLGLKAAALVTSDVEEKGFFQYSTAGGYHTRLSLPAFNEGFIVAGSDDVDVADPLVILFDQAMTLGLAVTGPATIQPTDEREDDITARDFAREVFRASGSRR